jgi:hypothetical protein
MNRLHSARLVASDFPILSHTKSAISPRFT